MNIKDIKEEGKEFKPWEITENGSVLFWGLCYGCGHIVPLNINGGWGYCDGCGDAFHYGISTSMIASVLKELGNEIKTDPWHPQWGAAIIDLALKLEALEKNGQQ
jgi:hypothetical protein